ncbi:hypothetical protein BGZ88_006526 [Linnemannia elongata]|nr:hypothetical protein BGZ88_006526 [Linnemannia elongata]KAF9340979.1 hypothetical protein BGZ91_011511 [Linnemannia elongata]KAG0074469.1 hypothetical protein BGZ90_010742 [Linnemannia elongata]
MTTQDYSDTHRLFLQAVISRRFMSEKDAIDLHARVCQATKGMSSPFDQDDFTDFINTVNDSLSSLEFEIRRAQDEANGDKILALTNTNEQKIAQVATGYTPLELEYFKHLLDAIVTADDELYCISSTAAVNEASKLKNKENKSLQLTKAGAEDLISRFVQDKWLIRSKKGALSLSTRTLLELQSFLKEAYEDQIQECTLCMEIITKGQRCNVAACAARLHQHCAMKYFGNMNNPVCPSCRSPWDGKTLIGLAPNAEAPHTIRRR